MAKVFKSWRPCLILGLGSSQCWGYGPDFDDHISEHPEWIETFGIPGVNPTDV